MLEIPVATTPKGKGVFPEDHRLSVGPFGYSGSPLAQWHLLESGVDVLLAVGTSLSEWGTLGWDRRLQPSEALLHVDIDPYEIGKNYQVTVPLIGDAKSGLTELLPTRSGGSSSAISTGGAATASSSRLRTARES